MSDRPRRMIPSHEPQVNALIAKSRQEHAARNKWHRHEPTSTYLFTSLALGSQLRTYPRSRVAGPLPPRSWAYSATISPTANSLSSTVTPHPQWRAHALRWILMHLEQPGLVPHSVIWPDEEDKSGPDRLAIPTLREACVQKLVSLALDSAIGGAQSKIYGSIFDPELPAHIRRFIVRWSAVHSPLPSHALEVLWGIEYGEQGADGEVILVGKDAGGFRTSAHLTKSILAPSELEEHSQKTDGEEQLAWDEEQYSPPPLTTFISIAHPLSKHLSIFPPTITHLALIAMPLDLDTTPRMLMVRLSGSLRILEALDLSCNPWLTTDAVETVDWVNRWQRLRFIAFIHCLNLRDDHSISNKINSKRSWERVIHIDFT